ncbi:ABC transporter ATP-binding protein [Terasakiella pusilla]|uniref:ATP-binding cassette domain-containing protein n=1 Tax=Terasakiella pusilla TaxID=64973 RepID=UPI00048AC205|nr:ABC transporter ATP-binding protein [Terasakiella pusilla]
MTQWIDYLDSSDGYIASFLKAFKDKKNVFLLMGALTFSFAGIALEGIGLLLLGPIFSLMQNSARPLDEIFPYADELHYFFENILNLEVGLLSLLVLLLILFTFNRLILMLKDYLITFVQESVNIELRRHFVAKYMHAEELSHILNLRQPFLTSMLNETYRVGQYYGYFVLFLTHMTMVFTYGLIAIYIEHTIVIFIFSVSIIFYLTYSKIIKSGSTFGRQLDDANRNFYWTMDEQVNRLRSDRLCGTIGYSYNKIISTADNLRQVTLKQKLINEIILNSTQIFFLTIVVTAMTISTVYFDINAISVAALGVIGIRSMPYIAGMNSSWNGILNTHEATVSLTKRGEEWGDQETLYEKGRKIKAFEEPIHFRNVTYYYSQNDQAAPVASVKDINLTINPRHCYVIIGKSGSGKTTLINLISSLEKPSEGDIFVGDTPLTDLDLRTYRQRIGYVEQHPTLVNGSILENLLQGLSYTPTKEEIEAALKAAHCEFINDLEGGLHYPVGYRGGALSGGQRQRIAIATEILRKTEIIIFDEPTSALDEKAETLIIDALKRLKQDHTIIIVSHSPNFSVIADCVIEMASGKILNIKKVLPEQTPNVTLQRNDTDYG